MLDVLLTDLRAGARGLCRAPGLTAAAVLTLAAGIAVNAVLFSLVRGLLASPLPFHEPDRLVRVLSERGGAAGKLSLPEIDDLNREARSFTGFASFRNTQYTVTGDGPPEAIPAAINTYNLFQVLGVRPHLGHTWPASHDRSRVFEVVLGHDLWRRRFGGDPGVVGRQVVLDGAPYTVLGVLPPGFDFPLGAGIYRRTPPGDYDSRAIREAGAVARLKPGVTLAQARRRRHGRAVAAHPAPRPPLLDDDRDRQRGARLHLRLGPGLGMRGRARPRPPGRPHRPGGDPPGGGPGRLRRAAPAAPAPVPGRRRGGPRRGAHRRRQPDGPQPGGPVAHRPRLRSRTRAHLAHRPALVAIQRRGADRALLPPAARRDRRPAGGRGRRGQRCAAARRSGPARGRQSPDLPPARPGRGRARSQSLSRGPRG